MYNKIVLMGNLTRDVEIRYSQGGSAIGNTGIAVNRKWKSQTGEQKSEVMFVDLTFFGRTAEIANQYLRKGAKVLVDGRLSFDQWTSKDGQKRSKHSVIVENLQMIGGRDDNQNGANGGGYNPHQGQPVQQQQNNQYQSNQNQYNNNQQNRGMQQQQQPYNNNANTQQPTYPEAKQEQPTKQPEIPSIDINEDEIPF